jgi:putative endonuclease
MHTNLFKNKRIIGSDAEQVAKEFLISNKYLILETNFRTKVGEIDIIAYEKKVDCLVFVEVKYRARDTFGLPQEAVTKVKQNKIVKTAFVYLKSINKKYNNYRFDVLAISEDNKIEHIKNAFCLEENF